MTMKRLSVLLPAAMLVFLFAACSDDEEPAAPPAPFQVVLQVTAPDGAPVPGLELGLAPDSRFYMDGKQGAEEGPDAHGELGWPYPSPFYPSAIIPFDLTQPGILRLTVEDIEGGPVRFLGERAADAGSHQWVWDGKNDEGTLVPSGVYYARLVLMDEDAGEVQVDFRREMLLAAFFADQVLIGTTDADGRLVIEDRKLFPYLYDLPLFPAMEETGAHMGIIEFTPTMRFYFTDPGTGTTLRFDGDVAGTTTLKFVWDPEEASRPQ
jgi:hypothetical protein